MNLTIEDSNFDTQDCPVKILRELLTEINFQAKGFEFRFKKPNFTETSFQVNDEQFFVFFNRIISFYHEFRKKAKVLINLFRKDPKFYFKVNFGKVPFRYKFLTSESNFSLEMDSKKFFSVFKTTPPEGFFSLVALFTRLKHKLFNIKVFIINEKSDGHNFKEEKIDLEKTDLLIYLQNYVEAVNGSVCKKENEKSSIVLSTGHLINNEDEEDF